MQFPVAGKSHAEADPAKPAADDNVERTQADLRLKEQALGTILLLSVCNRLPAARQTAVGAEQEVCRAWAQEAAHKVDWAVGKSQYVASIGAQGQLGLHRQPGARLLQQLSWSYRAMQAQQRGPQGQGQAQKQEAVLTSSR